MSEPKRKLTIYQQHESESPREWCNLGTFVGWHRRYRVGDKQPSVDPTEYLATLPEDEIVLPVYLYDHSGCAYSTTPFSCPWDSGQVGYIHCSPSNPDADGLDHDRIVTALRKEITDYSIWNSGEVYEYVIREWRTSQCGDAAHGSWEVVNSCGGYYGSDWDENGLAEDINPWDVKDQLADIEITY